MSRNIYCGFPGVGKSYLSKLIGCTDSDSSKFDKKLFPGNYIEHIKNLGGVVLVSTHLDVRDALFHGDMKFSICYPHKSLKLEYLRRYSERGSNNSFVHLLNKMWDVWIAEMENEHRAENHYVLQAGEFISDIEEFRND